MLVLDDAVYVPALSAVAVARSESSVDVYVLSPRADGCHRRILYLPRAVEYKFHAGAFPVGETREGRSCPAIVLSIIYS